MLKIVKLGRNEAGGTAIEYGLVAAFIAIAAVAAMQGLGSRVGTMYNNVSAQM